MSGRNGHAAPADYPPPVNSVGEFIKRELDDEDERIDVGVVMTLSGSNGGGNSLGATGIALSPSSL